MWLYKALIHSTSNTVCEQCGASVGMIDESFDVTAICIAKASTQTMNRSRL